MRRLYIHELPPDTALRDILQLVEFDILVRNPEGGRSSSYSLLEIG